MNSSPMEMINFTKKNVRFNERPNLIGSGTLFFSYPPIFETELGVFEGENLSSDGKSDNDPTEHPNK